jgi:hypothetical protein
METRRLGNEIERREDEIEDGDCEIVGLEIRRF